MMSKINLDFSHIRALLVDLAAFCSYRNLSRESKAAIRAWHSPFAE